MKRYIISIFLTAFFLVAFSSGNAAYQRYSIRDGLLNHQMLRIWIDSQGCIWGDTWERGFYFDGNQFHNFRIKSDDAVLKSAFLYFYETDSAKIIATRSGIAVFEEAAVETYPLPGSVVNSCRRIGDRFYLIKRDSLFSFSPQERSLRHEKISFSEVVDSTKFKGSTVDERRMTALSHSDKPYKFYKYSLRNGKIVELEGETEKIREDQFCERLSNEELHAYIPALKDVFIWDVLTDKNGVTWIGSEQGLLRMPPPAFISHSKQDGMPNYVWSIGEDPDSTFWFATFGNGMFRYKDGKYEEEKIMDIDNKKPIIYYYMGVAQIEGGFLQPHASGVLRRKNNRWEHIRELPETAYLFVYNDKESGTIFYSGYDTLVVYRNEQWEKYPSKTLLHNCPLAIAKDKKGRYWMGAGSPSTLHRYKEGEFVGFDEDELPFTGGLYSADSDGEGNLWIGNREGLYCYSYNNIDTIAIKEVSTIAAVKNYKDSLLLASGAEGLHCINLKKYYNKEPDYYSFLSSDRGLIVEGLGQQGIIVDSKERIWLISSLGVIQFFPERLRMTQNTPCPVIYSLRYSSPELSWEKRDLLFTDLSEPIYLNYPRCNIEINFGAISTSVNSGVMYSYKIEGYHNDWIEPTSDNRLVVTNLSPGEYRFKIRTVMENEQDYGSEKQLSFVIVPTFWQTFLFKFLVVISLVLVLLALIWGYIRRSRRRLLREMEVTNIQLASIKSQLNPHFIFNTMNSVGADLIDKNSEAYAKFSKLAQLIRKSLHDANSATKTLADELNFVEEYLALQKYRFKSKLEYSVVAEADVDLSILIPKMSIQLLVENAIFHGLETTSRKGFVEVHVEKDEKYLLISVGDNGSGFSETITTKGNGTGLKNLQKMIDIYNRFNKSDFLLKINTKKDLGTKVLLCIPHNYSFIIDKKMKKSRK